MLSITEIDCRKDDITLGYYNIWLNGFKKKPKEHCVVHRWKKGPSGVGLCRGTVSSFPGQHVVSFVLANVFYLTIPSSTSFSGIVFRDGLQSLPQILSNPWLPFNFTKHLFSQRAFNSRGCLFPVKVLERNKLLFKEIFIRSFKL